MLLLYCSWCARTYATSFWAWICTRHQLSRSSILWHSLQLSNKVRRDVGEWHTLYLATHRPLPPVVFAFKYTEPFEANGWAVYDPIAEFKRIGVPNEDWRISYANSKYAVCSTYPAILATPASYVLSLLGWQVIMLPRLTPSSMIQRV